MAWLVDSAKSLLRPVVATVRQRHRQSTLRQTRPPIGRERLIADLDTLPIARGAVVLVHSSLKSIGFVEGGAQTVVDSLVASIVDKRGGTLLLPTFSIDGTMHQTLASGRVFDSRSTPSNLGAIPETFRRQATTRRSLHPSHSFGALGSQAEELVARHHLAGTNFGRGTPMGLLIDRPAYLLGLGSDIGHVTFTHVVEDVEPDFPLRVYADPPFEVDCIDVAGATHRVRLPAHAPGEMQRRRIDHPENGFLRDFFAGWFEAHAGLTWHGVGEARCWLVPADAMYREFAALMRQGITIYARPEEIAAFQARTPVGASQ